MTDRLPGTALPVDETRHLRVDEVLYWYDEPMLFVGTLDPPIENGPNVFISIESARGYVVHMGTRLDEGEIEALRSDTLAIRDAFDRDGTFATRCVEEWRLAESSTFERRSDIPEDWLSAPGTMLHPQTPAPAV